MGESYHHTAYTGQLPGHRNGTYRQMSLNVLVTLAYCPKVDLFRQISQLQGTNPSPSCLTTTSNNWDKSPRNIVRRLAMWLCAHFAGMQIEAKPIKVTSQLLVSNITSSSAIHQAISLLCNEWHNVGRPWK